MMLWRRLLYLLPSYRRAQESDMREELASLASLAKPRELGNLTRTAEDARTVWGWTWLEGLLADSRYACRTLWRRPVFATVAIGSLALGIGANAAIFSLMDALLWRDLPVREPDRLVTFVNSSRSYFGYTRFTQNSGAAMESMIASSGTMTRPLDVGSGAERGQIEFVSGNFFPALGVNAQIGRALAPEDDRRGNPTPAALLSDAFWRKAYGARPVLGQTIRVEKTVFTIVGVAPSEFFGVSVDDAPDVWLPLTTLPQVFSGPNWLDMKNNNFLTIVGRLLPGVSLQQAAAALTPVNIQIDIERNGPPQTEKERRGLFESKLQLQPVAKGISFLRNRFSKPLRVVFWMVAIVLLLACVNVMTLEFARTDERRRELSVRLAIGAGRIRIARQLITESMVIALAGGFIGLALRRPLGSALLRGIIVWEDQPARLNLELHPAVVFFVAGASVAAALLCGVLPAMRATRGDLMPGLQHGSRGATRTPARRTMGRIVIAAQLAISMVLIAGACLFAYSLRQLRQFDAGVNRDRLLLVEVDPADAGYIGTRLIALNQRLRDRLASIPGVAAVSFSQNGIYSARNYSTRFDADGFANADGRSHYSHYDHVGPSFFTAAGAHIRAGRDFNERDDAGAPNVAIVTSEFARRVFDQRDPVGRNLYVTTGQLTQVSYRIVGVVQDIRNDVRSPEPMFYLSQLQTQVQAFSTMFLVRTQVDPVAVASGLRTAVRAEDGALRVDQIVSAWDLFDRTVATDRLMAVLAFAFGVLALVLAAVGVYGLLSYEVTSRTGEIGIRMAIGAQQGDVIALVMREVIFVCALGVAAGAGAALGMARFVQGLVFQMKAGDPLMELLAAMILLCVAVGAAWIPARRAARMDPMSALRIQ